jgi:hypothetical protein
MNKLTIFMFIFLSSLLFAQVNDKKPPPLLITESQLQKIYHIGKENNVPLSIVRQQIKEESGGDCHARSNLTAEGFYSKGILQIYDKPGNVDWLLWKFWKDDPKDFDIYDPIDNATLALRYLSWLHRQYGSWYKALIFYNHGDIKGYSEETRAYALRIIKAE